MAGFEEEVAVKVLSKHCIQPDNVEQAMQEVHLMCIVSQHLGGRAVELKGFLHDPDDGLILVLELAEHSLDKWLKQMPHNRLPLDQWV